MLFNVFVIAGLLLVAVADLSAQDSRPRQPDEREASREVSHWSFRPIVRPQPPPVLASRSRNGIDAFILHRLEREGIAPSPEADRATLIRRVSLDLIGLPLTPDQVVALHRVESLESERTDQQCERVSLIVTFCVWRVLLLRPKGAAIRKPSGNALG